MTLNVDEVRADFPILLRKVHGQPLTYFDNAATSQKPAQVVRAITDYYERYNANIHRGIHQLAEEATRAHEEAREKVARFVNSRRSEEIVFVRNTTEAINLVANTWGRANVSEGDKIVLTILEHHSNIVPWQLLAREKKATIRFIGIDAEGRLNMDEAARIIDRRTRVVSVAHVSNVLGTVNPVKELAKLAHGAGAVLLADAAQAVPHMPTDFEALECDFMAFSGHKMLGPTGIGVLCGRLETLEAMPPFLGGGEMIREVHATESTWKNPPYKFEAGTVNIAGAIGLGAAIDYLEKKGMKNIQRHEEELTKHTLEGISKSSGITVYGPQTVEDRGGVIAFNVGDIHAHDLASILDEDGVAVRSGQHCAQPLMEYLHIPAAVRASFYLYNTFGEVDRMLSGIEKAKELFRR